MNTVSPRESEIRAYSRVYPVVFKTAVNARQTDESGKEYIDFFAGAGVLNFGHNNPKMKNAIIDYLQNDGVLHSLDLLTTARCEFINAFEKRILEPRNMPHRLQFTGPTGTNAVEAAMKLARRVSGRKNIIAFQQGFHGMTLGALAATANEYFRAAAGVPLDYVSHAAFNDMAALEEMRKHFQASADNLPAAFLLEIIQAEGGVNLAEKHWIESLASLAKEFGVLLIVDDIQVGCGRTGSYFSFDGFDLQPDIICLAKGVGGIGTPLAFNLVLPELDDHWSPGEHTGTFRGQNLSFVAGKVALDYFADDVLMNLVAEQEKLVNSSLSALLSADSSLQLRGRGMIVGLDVGCGERAASIVSRCFAKGLIVASCGIGGRVIKLIPPLTIPRSDLEQGLEILVDSVLSVLEEAA